jgi:hypothetical protein
MSARKLPPEQGKPDSVSEAAKRLAAIVEAAERAASSVIDDAEAQAQRTIDEAQARADRLVAERLRAIADELDPLEDGEDAKPRLRTVDPPPEPEPEMAASEGIGQDSEPMTPRRTKEAGARLLATQMAVSGSSRAEIADRLRRGCGIADPEPLLEAILGPGE